MKKQDITPVKMNPRIKKKWVAALRSGEYEQGTGQLVRRIEGYEGEEDTYKFCCLGVLQNLYHEEHGTAFKPREFVREAHSAKAGQWCGLPRTSRMVDLLITMNDGHIYGKWSGKNRKTFKQIALFIERNL